MVQHQIVSRGIGGPKLVQALLQVPRHEFVPAHLRRWAYDDCPLTIGYGQTISQPYTVAFQCQALDLQGDEKVLEIGTGSGYCAAVLSQLASEVHSVERIEELFERTSELFRRLQARRNLGNDSLPDLSNVHLYRSDGSLGLPSQAPFDAILVAAAAESIPAALLDQLADGGRLVIPVGSQSVGQHMLKISRHAGRYTQADLGTFSFVPLICE